MKRRNKSLAILILISFLLPLFFMGCITETIRPSAPVVQQASFDGTKQDSGLITLTPKGAVVTAHYRERFNSLVATYGAERDFKPPLVADQGVTPAPADVTAAYPDRGDLFLMADQSVAQMAKMTRWKKMGRVPASQAPVKPGVVARVVDAVLK